MQRQNRSVSLLMWENGILFGGRAVLVRAKTNMQEPFGPSEVRINQEQIVSTCGLRCQVLLLVDP